jgi:hypothetical protein
MHGYFWGTGDLYGRMKKIRMKGITMIGQLAGCKLTKKEIETGQ